MDFQLSEEQEMLRTSARDFLQKECPKQLVRQLHESDEGYSPELWRWSGGKTIYEHKAL